MALPLRIAGNRPLPVVALAPPLGPLETLGRVLGEVRQLDRLRQADAVEALAGLLRGVAGRERHVAWLTEAAARLRRWSGAGLRPRLSLGALAVIDCWRPLFEDALRAGRFSEGTNPADRLRALVAGLPGEIGPVGPPVPIPPAARLLSHHADPIREPGKVAAALWRARSRGEAQAIFDAAFYPQGRVTGVADLGAGRAEFAIGLARRFPGARVFAIDRRPIPLLDLPDLPSNLVGAGGLEASGFLGSTAWRSFKGLLDRVYLLMPTEDLVPGSLGPVVRLIGGGGEIHILTHSDETAEAALRFFEPTDFVARRLEIPDDLIPETDWWELFARRQAKFSWVVARKTSRRPTARLLPALSLEPERPPIPRLLRLGYDPVVAFDDTQVPEWTRRLLGQPIPLRTLLRAFHVDDPRYRLDTLQLMGRAGGGITVRGTIVDGEGREVGRWTRSILRPPEPGRPWIAEGDGMDVALPRQGIGRALTRRFVRFLVDLGVDRMVMRAGRAGSYVLAHMGFSTRTETLARRKEGYLAYLTAEGYRIDDALHAEIAGMRYLWEISEHRVYHSERKRMERTGEAFLLRLGAEGDEWEATFPVSDPDYPGWGMLVKSHPRWIGVLSPESIETLWRFYSDLGEIPLLLLADDAKLGEVMAERVNNLSGGLLLAAETPSEDPGWILERPGTAAHFGAMVDILAWMAGESRSRSRLFAAFWERIGPRNQQRMGEILRLVRRLTGREIEIVPPQAGR